MIWVYQSFLEKLYLEKVNDRVYGVLCCCDDKCDLICSWGYGVRVDINYDFCKLVWYIEI